VAPDWLRWEVGEGLQKLLSLRLQGAPPVDAVLGTAQVWLEALMAAPISWQEVQDRQRVRTGFARLCIECDRWPAPRHLLQQLPDRQPEYPALPHKIDPKQLERNRQRIRKILGSLANRKGIK